MAQEVGTLLPIYLEEIEPLISTKAHQFLITQAAKAINEAGGHNSIPVIVKQMGAENYQAIANIFILVAAKEAGIDQVWCIVADDSAITQKSSQLLSQELTPTVNLATATRDEIKLALDYLINRPVNPLVGVNLATALDKIDNPHRQSWKEDLKEVVALKCKITTGKKLDIFKEVFYVTPQPEPERPEPVNLATATRDEIKLALDYLINRSINPLGGVRLATALDKIDGVSRQSWKEDLKEVVALRCGITTGKKLDIFKEVFYITPQLPPPPPPPVNLATATKDEIYVGLNYLINRSDNPLVGVTLTTAVDKIDNPYRQYWKQDLKEVTALRCGITAAKMKIFKEIFYTTSQEIPEDTKDRVLLSTLTVTELKKMAEKRGLSEFKTRIPQVDSRDRVIHLYYMD
jgi:hypothetical protein